MGAVALSAKLVFCRPAFVVVGMLIAGSLGGCALSPGKLAKRAVKHTLQPAGRAAKETIAASVAARGEKMTAHLLDEEEKEHLERLEDLIVGAPSPAFHGAGDAAAKRALGRRHSLQRSRPSRDDRSPKEFALDVIEETGEVLDDPALRILAAWTRGGSEYAFFGDGAFARAHIHTKLIRYRAQVDLLSASAVGAGAVVTRQKRKSLPPSTELPPVVTTLQVPETVGTTDEYLRAYHEAGARLD